MKNEVGIYLNQRKLNIENDHVNVEEASWLVLDQIRKISCSEGRRLGILREED